RGLPLPLSKPLPVLVFQHLSRQLPSRFIERLWLPVPKPRRPVLPASPVRCRQRQNESVVVEPAPLPGDVPRKIGRPWRQLLPLVRKKRPKGESEGLLLRDGDQIVAHCWRLSGSIQRVT